MLRCTAAASRTTSWPATRARGQDADGGGLARPVRPEYAEDGPGRNLEVDAGQGHGLAVPHLGEDPGAVSDHQQQTLAFRPRLTLNIGCQLLVVPANDHYMITPGTGRRLGRRPGAARSCQILFLVYRPTCAESAALGA
jgi:hypothetical protein